MAHTLGGQVTAAQEDTAREYGKTRTYYDTGCKIFQGLPAEGTSWMSHGDYMALSLIHIFRYAITVWSEDTGIILRRKGKGALGK